MANNRSTKICFNRKALNHTSTPRFARGYTGQQVLSNTENLWYHTIMMSRPWLYLKWNWGHGQVMVLTSPRAYNLNCAPNKKQSCFTKWKEQWWMMNKETVICSVSVFCVYMHGFFSLGGTGGSPIRWKFCQSPPSDTCPRFWTKACPPPQPRFVPKNLKHLNTFLCQIWLLLSSTVPYKGVFHA